MLVWAKRCLQAQVPGIARVGVKRLDWDIFAIDGQVELDADGQITRIVLNQADRHSRWLFTTLQTLAASADVAVPLGET